MIHKSEDLPGKLIYSPWIREYKLDLEEKRDNPGSVEKTVRGFLFKDPPDIIIYLLLAGY